MTAQDPSNAPADRLPIPGRFDGIQRDFSAEDVQKLSGSVRVRHTLAERGADKLWRLLHERDHVHALGALTGNQAMQMVKGGLEAIYLSGWQVAADANVAGHMYPDQSLYPANSVPEVVRKINRTLARADQIAHSEGDSSIDYFAPIVADAFRAGDYYSNLWQEVPPMPHLLFALAFVAGMLCPESAVASEAEDFHEYYSYFQGKWIFVDSGKETVLECRNRVTYKY